MIIEGFLNSTALNYLYGLIPLAVFLILRTRRKILDIKTLRVKISNKTLYYSNIISFIVIALIIFSLSRPYSAFEEIEVSQYGRDRMLVLDISLSMLTKDLGENRLEVAKRKIFDLIDLQKQNKSLDRIGIVLFAGDSYLYCPLTTDYSALRQFISSINQEFISARGSNLSHAISTAIESFKNSNAQQPQIILFSDGEDDQFDLEKSILLAKESQIQISILGIGTLEGKPIEISRGQFLKDQKNQIVISKLSQEALIKLAEATSGKYQKISLSDQDLIALLDFNQTKQNQNKNKDKLRIYHELGPICLIAALFLLILSTINAYRHVLFILVLALLPINSYAQDLHKAYQAYQNQDYQLALKEFEKAHEAAPNDLKVLQSLGSTHYKLGNFKEAAKIFEQMNTLANNGRDKFAANYNSGNSNLELKNPSAAIDNYENALKIKPDDQAAKFNLDLAKKLLAEEKKNQEQNKDKEKKKEENSEKSEQQDNNQNQSQDNKQNQQEKDQSSDNQQNEQQEQKQQEQNQQQNESDQSEQDKDQQQHEPQTQQESSANQQQEKKPLSQVEAENWLESLPDSPVLLRRKTSQSYEQQSQTW